jgi:type VI secretion system secreted protein VgrG
MFELEAGSLTASDLVVIGISGREGLSELFWFQVDFFPAALDLIPLADLFGKDALLTLRRPGGRDRIVSGMIARAEMVDVESGKPRYRVRIVPKLLGLSRVRRSRIFQALSVPEIVKKVLDERKISHREALGGSYPAREYTVQYRETDLEFVMRLLESEGIFFFFEHTGRKHVLALVDETSSCEPITGDPNVPYHTGENAAGFEEYLQALSQTRQLSSGKATLRDYDFEKPGLEVAGDSADSADPFGLEVYDHATDYVSPADAKRVSTVRLEGLRCGADTVEGKGTCLRMVPGCTFEASNHPDDSIDKNYLLVRLDHLGRQKGGFSGNTSDDDIYFNRFTAIDASLPFRPQRQTRRPVIAGAQSAVVVGPPGEEIYPDKYGRVKVQFHWDRDGQRDDQSSCWVRLGQAWAGTGFGASFVPRIGQEVVIRFLEGNPDRPIVGGAVYNGQNVTPIALPEEKTKSTLRTASSLGSNGFNEARIEDAQGQEEVYLHGQKDENVEVLNDKTQTVMRNEALHVMKDRSLEVDGNQSLRVIGNDESTVDGNQSNTVTKDRKTTVLQNHEEEIGGSQSISVAHSQSVRVIKDATVDVGAAAALSVGGAYGLTVGADSEETVGGVKSVKVGALRREVVKRDRDETVQKSLMLRTGGESELQVLGEVKLGSVKDAKEEIGGAVELEVKGPLVWFAKSFDIKADKFRILVDGKLALSLDKSGNKVAWGASNITFDGNTKLKGQIKKSSGGSPSSASVSVKQLQDLSDEKVTLRVSIVDSGGAPALNGEKYEAHLPDGTKKKGKVKEGQIAIDGLKPDDKCKIVFPGLK